MRVGFDGFHSGLHGLFNALAHDHGIGPGGNIFQTLADDGLSKQGSGGRAVAGYVVGFGGDFPDQLSAHILKGVFQLHILGDGHAVVGDEGSAVLFPQDHVPALGTQGDFHGIGQLVNATLQILASILAIDNHFSHNA